MSIQPVHTQNASYSSKPAVAKDTTPEKSTLPVLSDTFEKSAETQPKAPYNKPKGLSEKELRALKDSQAESQSQLLEKMMGANVSNQANNSLLATNSKELITKIFGSYEKGLPPLATTPEEARLAIEKGGAYSIDAVATRILDMAKGLSGGDASKFNLLKEATEKGFKQAGIDFEKGSNQKLPQICQDTYKEVMKGFDTWEKELKA